MAEQVRATIARCRPAGLPVTASVGVCTERALLAADVVPFGA